MGEGLATPHERVLKLKALFDMLFEQLQEAGPNGVLHNLWLPDFKIAGNEVYDIERYNSPIIGDIRGLLDDLAKETGGRKLRTDITSGDEPIVGIEIVKPDPNGQPKESIESLSD